MMKNVKVLFLMAYTCIRWFLECFPELPHCLFLSCLTWHHVTYSDSALDLQMEHVSTVHG